MYIQEQRLTQWSRTHSGSNNFLQLEETLFLLTSKRTGMKVSPSMTAPKLLESYEAGMISENTETNKPLWKYLQENLSWFDKDYEFILVLSLDNKKQIFTRESAVNYISENAVVFTAR